MDPDRGAGASGSADGDSSLIRAVRAADTDLVKKLLLLDSDPGLLNAAFCLAVRTYSGGIAQLLLDHGADPGSCLPDELMPLREAVESGSPALVDVLLHHSIRERYPRSELSRMRDLARHWHDTGVETELRRRTGSRGAVGRTRVEDDEFYSVDELTLGEVTVRDGHAAILTRLEELLGIRSSFEELRDRALAHCDQDHAVWGAATIQLSSRCDQQTWTAAAALRAHPDPAHRLFGAEVLRLTHLFDGSDEDAFAGPALSVFTEWATEEADLAVLTEVLVALGEHADARADAALMLYAGHPDPRVRGAVARGLGTWSELPAFSDDVREALLVLMADRDTAVRRDACLTVGQAKDRDPVLAEGMAALLDDAERSVQVAAVHGLALHDDERCVEASRRLGPPQPGTFPEEHYLDAAWRYAWRHGA
ncbi:HEAT repeat domain-containing protein [Streptomyces sp. NBC_00638]|uniref:HEAT repeat domain-containing protein n=1 Tax=unclassified Streptomyces TaxID=2593676 RepID=UPI002255D5A5|nr:HEAT repeat domain-containing protein [Streptomyces sp. NBC_00638]MCX5008979.1 HEAT repeat domain-containing protein [Streptomyces sp. NBC_00638]